MHIVVLIKQIFDPDVATTVFRIDKEAQAIVPLPGVSPVISPFDEQAVEAAMRIKDVCEQNLEGEKNDVRVTVVTMAEETARVAIKGELAKGADEGLLLVDPLFENADAVLTANILATAIRKLGDVDLIIAGRQAADKDLGVVGLGIAQLLDIPAITYACDIAINNKTVLVERVLEDGTEKVQTQLPALVTISHELGKPRYAGLRETMRAARKPINVWNASDLKIDTDIGYGRQHIEELFIPDNKVNCELIQGDTPDDVAFQLATRLKEADLI